MAESFERPAGDAEPTGQHLPDFGDDTGAQAAEYAMLGGVSAAACSGLMVLLRNQDTLSGVVEAVVGALGGFVGSWF